MSTIFEIKEHVIPGQHIREFPRATGVSQDEPLFLSIKQYTPFDNLAPQPGDITIIGAHANGFPKELYEPLWETLHAHSKEQGFRIRGIWIADVAHQGRSGIINEQRLGNDPAWYDHARDLLHMINHFRDVMPRPIVGIGHSMGANQLVNLSYMHPRLFTSLVLLDPVITDNRDADPNSGPLPAQASSFRRDLWPSLQEAQAGFLKSKFYKSWDPRVLDRWLQFGLRSVPTVVYPTGEGSTTPKDAVTLATSKHQEVFTFLRPFWDNFDGLAAKKEHPEIDAEKQKLHNFHFYRSEIPMTFARLGQLRPMVLYVFGGESQMSKADAQPLKLERTGVGLGGSGGVKLGRVKGVSLDGVGHLVAMEDVEGCARPAAEWLGKAVKEWKEDEARYLEWARQSVREKTTLSEKWLAEMKKPIVLKGKL